MLTCADSAHSQPPTPSYLSTAVASMISIWPASTFRRSRAIRSNASKLRGATAAPCSTATTPSAALSTSSPRTAREERHFRFARKPVWDRSISAWDRSRPHQTRVPGQRPSSETGSTPTDIGRITRSRNKMVSARFATPRLTSLHFSTYPATISSSDFPGGRTVNPSTGVNELVTDRTGTDHPVRLWQQTRRQRHRRIYQDVVERRANSSSMVVYETRSSRRASSATSLCRTSTPATSIPDCRPGR